MRTKYLLLAPPMENQTREYQYQMREITPDGYCVRCFRTAGGKFTVRIVGKWKHLLLHPSEWELYDSMAKPEDLPDWGLKSIGEHCIDIIGAEWAVRRR